jgi:hypothetical protein
MYIPFGRIMASIDTVRYVDSTRAAGLTGGVTGTTDTTAIIAAAANHPEIFAGGGSGFGTGPYSATVIMYDTSNSQPVPGAVIAAKSLNQVIGYGFGRSDANGNVAANFTDTGRYLVSTFAPGYVFAAFDTIHITSTALTDTIKGYQFDPGSPADPSYCRLYGFVYSGVGGNPAGVKGVKLNISYPNYRITYQGNVITIRDNFRTTTTDATGYWYFDVARSSALTPDTTKYIINGNYPSGAIFGPVKTLAPDSASHKVIMTP